MRTVFVVNSGSSSIKYQLIDPDAQLSLASGLVERIGEPLGRIKHQAGEISHEEETPVPDHTAGLRRVLELFAEVGPSLADAAIAAVGHRVVQGGDAEGAQLVTDEVKAHIAALAPLAPLHNPANLQGVEAAQAAFPDVPHVVVYDTAFHHTLPMAARTYAIDPELAARHRIRRYGAHGTSHKFVSEQVAAHLGRPLAEVNTIVLHLGNGASATAVRGGVSVETSMGLTPLEGLVMGTRSGDLDPAIVVYLQRAAGMTADEVDALLNRHSGMLAMTGSNDLRDAHAKASAGDAAAQLALDVYCHRIKSYVGAYYAQLGRVDAIAFTAGVGENDGRVRAGALAGLESLGIEIDAERNGTTRPNATRISTDSSRVAVLVIPTNEELEIALQCLALIA